MHQVELNQFSFTDLFEALSVDQFHEHSARCTQKYYNSVLTRLLTNLGQVKTVVTGHFSTLNTSYVYSLEEKKKTPRVSSIHQLNSPIGSADYVVFHLAFDSGQTDSNAELTRIGEGLIKTVTDSTQVINSFFL